MDQSKDKMKTEIIFRAGLRTIGGTIVEVIKNDKRIIFDFGEEFDPQKNESKTPEVEGIYDNSGIDTIVLISHLHLDHTKAMNLVHKDIPVYMLEDSVNFLEDLYKIGFDGLKGEKREYNSIGVNDTLNFGEFVIKPLLVDHDVKGACAFLIQTDDVNILYSGDIRINGYNSQKTFDMIKFIQNMNQKIDVAIFEGVSISFIEDDYEIIPTAEVLEENKEESFSLIIQKNIDKKKIYFVNPYIMGMERLKSIFEYAKLTNKKVYLTSNFAYLCNKYYPDYKFFLLEENKYNLNKEIVQINNIDENSIVFFDYLQKEKYLELLNKFKGETVLLQTGGEPLGEFDPRWKELEEYCSVNKLELFPIGASGHASAENLMYIIEQINPKYLFPLHSFKPELVKSKKESIEQILPQKDYIYSFKNHKLVDGE